MTTQFAADEMGRVLHDRILVSFILFRYSDMEVAFRS